MRETRGEESVAMTQYIIIMFLTTTRGKREVLHWPVHIIIIKFLRTAREHERSRQEKEARVGWVIRQIQTGVVVWDH